jgi:LPXTG-motif cell wall-anchored protein
MGYGSDGTLPQTGFDMWAPLLFLVVVLVSGLCLYLAGRRA